MLSASRRGSKNKGAEQAYLKKKQLPYDWIQLSNLLKENNIAVHPIINQSTFETASFYTVMADITGGDALLINQTTPKVITEVTVNLLLSLMG